MDIYQQALTRWQEQRRARRAEHAANQKVIFNALAALGIECVEVRFDGYGDSGQIDQIVVAGGFGALNGHVTLMDAAQPRICTLEEAVEELCYGLLEFEHEGWQDNDGAFGTFVFDVAQRIIEIEFNGRYTDHETFMHTFGEA